jgi:MFS family permease
MRALAIAFFYAVGTGVGGVIGPALFGELVATGARGTLAWGYAGAAALMLAGGAAALWLGEAAERRSLEDVAAPLAAAD